MPHTRADSLADWSEAVGWTSEVYELPEGHGWTARPGHKILVLDSGAVVLEFPAEAMCHPRDCFSMRRASRVPLTPALGPRPRAAVPAHLRLLARGCGAADRGVRGSAAVAAARPAAGGSDPRPEARIGRTARYLSSLVVHAATSTRNWTIVYRLRRVEKIRLWQRVSNGPRELHRLA